MRTPSFSMTGSASAFPLCGSAFSLLGLALLPTLASCGAESIPPQKTVAKAEEPNKIEAQKKPAGASPEQTQNPAGAPVVASGKEVLPTAPALPPQQIVQNPAVQTSIQPAPSSQSQMQALPEKIELDELNFTAQRALVLRNTKAEGFDPDESAPPRSEVFGFISASSVFARRDLRTKKWISLPSTKQMFSKSYKNSEQKISCAASVEVNARLTLSYVLVVPENDSFRILKPVLRKKSSGTPGYTLSELTVLKNSSKFFLQCTDMQPKDTTKEAIVAELQGVLQNFLKLH